MFRVLIIENNITKAGLTARAVQDLKFGVQIRYSLSITQALFYLAALRRDPRRTLPDMIIVGDALPDVHGPTVVQLLADALKKDAAPIVVVSDTTPAADTAEYFRRQASAVITAQPDPKSYVRQVTETVCFVAMVHGLVPRQPQFFPADPPRPASFSDILQVYL